MNSFTILHYQKSRGASSGALGIYIFRGRKNENGEWVAFIPPNADATRTHLNRQFIRPDICNTLEQRICSRIKEALQGRTVRSNQVRFINVLLSMSPDAAVRIISEGKIEEWCQSSIEWLQHTHGDENIVSAVLHMDEKTPHIHATLVPIVQGISKCQAYHQKKAILNGDIPLKKRKYKKLKTDTLRLCAADVMDRIRLKGYQTSYAKAMEKFGLHRGIEGSKARHIDTDSWYKSLYNYT